MNTQSTIDDAVELELIDLGDASVETRQPAPFHEIKDTYFTWTYWA